MGGIDVVRRAKTGAVHTLSDGIFDGMLYLIVTVFCIMIVFPMLYVLSVSLTPYSEVLKGDFILFPKKITLDGYRTILGTGIPNAFKVTVFITVVGTAINLFVTVLLAYPMSKSYLPGKKLLSTAVLIPMLFSGGQIPTYMIVKNLGLLNTIWALILPASITSYNVILMRTFFKALPEEMFEAARIDGAGELTCLVKFALPVSMPMLMTNLMFFAVWHWNTYISSVLYISSDALKPLQVVLRDIIAGTEQLTDGVDVNTSTETLKNASVVICTIPILLIYPFIQKHFTKGMMLGSLKG